MYTSQFAAFVIFNFANSFLNLTNPYFAIIWIRDFVPLKKKKKLPSKMQLLKVVAAAPHNCKELTTYGDKFITMYTCNLLKYFNLSLLKLTLHAVKH